MSLATVTRKLDTLSTGTFARPPTLADHDDPRVLYAKSYLTIRIAVGVIGILLPVLLILTEAVLLDDPVRIRGSISAYYHSPARDLLVAGLSVTGFLLITYMAGQRRTLDFALSTVAGVTVIGVAFVPTMRPGLVATDVRCGSTSPAPAGCSPVQQHLGETLTATIHFACAGIFIVSLAAIAFLFAYRETRFRGSAGRARTQAGCGLAILLAVAVVAIGESADIRFGDLTPLYLGEVASILAFGVSWLLAASALFRGSGPRSTRQTGDRDV